MQGAPCTCLILYLTLKLPEARGAFRAGLFPGKPTARPRFPFRRKPLSWHARLAGHAKHLNCDFNDYHETYDCFTGHRSMSLFRAFAVQTVSETRGFSKCNARCFVRCTCAAPTPRGKFLGNGKCTPCASLLCKWQISSFAHVETQNLASLPLRANINCLLSSWQIFSPQIASLNSSSLGVSPPQRCRALLSRGNYLPPVGAKHLPPSSLCLLLPSAADASPFLHARLADKLKSNQEYFFCADGCGCKSRAKHPPGKDADG